MTRRHSPLHDVITPLNPHWGDIQGMAIALRMDNDPRPAGIRLGDASCLPRVGVKGARAEGWLTEQGIAPLPGVNGWLRTPAGLLVARLARSEFFLEDSATGDTVQRLKHALTPASGMTPVLRQDGALVLTGSRVNELLTQVCNINFLIWQPDDRVVVMTSMVGVSVLVLWQEHRGMRRYRIWCDHSFGPYLWETLLDIARELGGGAVGLRSLFPQYIA